MQFPDGTCVLRWATDDSSTAVYESLRVLLAIHGHGGSTLVRWIDPDHRDPTDHDDGRR